ncbi:glycosyltransferase [Azohydromonas aeria]|uniref:glycosyltransferase n=1 Tax=Azohydromonas aeria TaxID=2590212 RepID=UPI0012F7B9C6|nr:glycosyltransferase [Azohydromonas aeria]
MNILQNLVLPNLEVQAPEDLYVRLNDKAWCRLDQPALCFEPGGVATTDTYYGALSVTTWRRHCALGAVVLQLEGEGRFVASLGLHRHGQAPVWLAEREVELAAGAAAAQLPVPGWDTLPDGLLFLRLRALTPGRLTAGRWATPQPAVSPVRLGLVVTHFNRVAQVMGAVERIRRSLLRAPALRGRITLTVVDNSRNLPLASDAEVSVIPNRNLGGSGGFARGMLALADGAEHTHVLLMDDDASCEPESIARTLALLSHARTPRLAVAGALVSELHPWQLLEHGAGFDGFCIPMGIGADLRSVSTLLDCDRPPRRPDFGGWWFFAFALADVRHWPFPFFVRGDDVFFGLMNRFEITTLTGVACYGEDFHLKHGPMTAYLDARYHLMHALLRERGAVRALLRVIKLRFVKPLAGYHYASAQALTLALRHVAAGPQFFRDHMDLAQVRTQIAALRPAEKLEPIDRAGLDLRTPRRSQHESPLRRAARTLTLQGMLLPPALLRSRKRVLVHDKDFFGRARDVWRFRRVLYRHGQSDTGYLVELDRARVAAEVRDLLRTLLPVLRRLPELRRDYAQALQQMGTAAFWREVYGLPQGSGGAPAGVPAALDGAAAPAGMAVARPAATASPSA